MNKITHQPKGLMCANCMFALDDCSKLDFKSMRQIGLSAGVIIVKCTMFSRTGK